MFDRIRARGSFNASNQELLQQCVLWNWRLARKLKFFLPFLNSVYAYVDIKTDKGYLLQKICAKKTNLINYCATN